MSHAEEGRSASPTSLRFIMLRRLCLSILLVFCIKGFVQAQKNFRITSDGAGGIRLGMTVKQARASLPKCRFVRTSDGEGVALVGVRCGGKEIITFYTGEEDVSKKIDQLRRIEFIEVWDPRFKTADGVHVDMPLRDVERILGKVKEIEITPIESREYVTFSKDRKGIGYRTYGGIYVRPNVKTKKYEPGSTIHSIQVSR